MSRPILRAVLAVVCGGALLAGFSAPVFAYGIDGMFGGRPNPSGIVTLDVPLQTEVAPDRAQSVLDHPRSDYDPVPLALGSFFVYPSVEAGIASDSNIYATPRGTSDAVFSLDPAVTAHSDWGRHFLSVTASGDLNFFQNHSDQNTTNTLFQADGRYDLLNQTWLAGRGGYQLQYVPRSTLNNTNGSEPTQFNLYSAGASAYRGAGIVRAQLDYDFDRFDYAATNDGAASLSAYNRNENKAGGKLSYAASEDFKPYVNAQINARDYDNTASRNSQGYKADFGAAWDFGGITSIDIYTGWLAQDYSSFGAQPVNQGVDFGGKLTWNVTGLTTVVFDASRSVEEAIIAGYSSFLATGGAATVTHELRRNILLEGDFSYASDAYRGFAPSRQDDIMTAGGGVRYLVNRNLYADLAYSWNHRASTVEGQGYVDHLIVAKLGLHL